jgi:O-antigen/teichoic acid export membrane protein/glycosyltransferase involved in cell wall biosynthesis
VTAHPSDTLRFSVVVTTHNRCAHLRAAVESLLAQDLTPKEFEIILVDDGSTDGTADYLQSLRCHDNVRWLRIENSGIPVARNAGVALARGKILAFTDDDCLVPQNWLIRIEDALRSSQAVAVGGTIRNKRQDNLPARAYSEMNESLRAQLNRNQEQPGFLTTNNSACMASTFRMFHGFDERFFHGAEDREFLARLQAAGEKVVFVDDIVVDHYQSFQLTSFLFHMYRQGRGSYLYYNVIRKESDLPREKGLVRRIFTMIKTALPRHNVIEGIKIASLIVLAQASAAFGYLSAAWEGITDLRKEGAERGTASGLTSFLAGTIASSIFGFFSFVIIGNALSIAEFGLFTVAFSFEAVLSTFCNAGLPVSVTRHASEYSKKNDKAGTASVLRSGLVLQVTLLIILCAAIFLISGFLTNRVFSVALSPSLILAVVVSACSTALFNYVTSIYSVHLRFYELALLRTVVSVLRILAVAIVAIFRETTAVNFFWAFTLPTWVGVAIALLPFYDAIKRQRAVHSRELGQIAIYSGWQSVTGISRILTTHLGPLILAIYSTDKEAGAFGLGLALSFVFAVIGGAIHAYFMPIGARIPSHNDIPEYIRRTLRLGFPFMLLSLVIVAFSGPLVRLIYGESRQIAVPIFALLSAPTIIQMAFTSVNNIFHYLFKPKYISYEVLVRLLLFLSGSILLSGHGALGVAAAYCAAGFISYTFSVVLLARELKRIGIRPQPLLWLSFGFSGTQ